MPVATRPLAARGLAAQLNLALARRRAGCVGQDALPTPTLAYETRRGGGPHGAGRSPPRAYDAAGGPLGLRLTTVTVTASAAAADGRPRTFAASTQTAKATETSNWHQSLSRTGEPLSGRARPSRLTPSVRES